MSRPAASCALMTQATASRYCSRNIESPSAALKDLPPRLSSNHSGRGYDPVIAVGSIRSRVTLSIDSLLAAGSGLLASGLAESEVDPTARASARCRSVNHAKDRPVFPLGAVRGLFLQRQHLARPRAATLTAQ